MPFNRTYRRSRTYRRRRRYNRRLNRYRRRQIVAPRIGRRIVQPVFYFKRNVEFLDIPSDGTGTEGIHSYDFTLVDVPGYTEFTTLFDFYTIKAVKLTFLPVSNVAIGNPDSPAILAVTQSNWQLYTVLDYNSVDISGQNISDLMEYKTLKVTTINQRHTRYFKPRIAMASQTLGGVVSDVEGPRNAWIRTTSPTARFFGIKLGFEQVNDSTAIRFSVRATYYMAFKNPL